MQIPSTEFTNGNPLWFGWISLPGWQELGMWGLISAASFIGGCPAVGLSQSPLCSCCGRVTWILSPFHFWRPHRFLLFFFGFLFSFSWLKWMPASLSNLLSAFFPQSTAVGGRRHSSHFSLFVPIVFASLWVMMEEKKGDFCFIKLRLEWLSLCA